MASLVADLLELLYGFVLVSDLPQLLLVTCSFSQSYRASLKIGQVLVLVQRLRLLRYISSLILYIHMKTIAYKA